MSGRIFSLQDLNSFETVFIHYNKAQSKDPM
jgi:hypothetical protein